MSPRPRLLTTTPLFVVSDLPRSLAFYERLGFHARRTWGGDPEAVGRFLASPSQPVDFGGQRRKPVGFVAAQMRDPAELRHRTFRGQRRERRDGGRQLADVVQIDLEAAVLLRALHLQV